MHAAQQSQCNYPEGSSNTALTYKRKLVCHNSRRGIASGTKEQVSSYHKGTDAHNNNMPTPIIVIFGRPGAGKSTVANAAIAQAKAAGIGNTLALDLDVCVPQWMRDNFAKGIYPTLQQRKEFALSACDYVDSKLSSDSSSANNAVESHDIESSADISAAIISFSFVNTDLRDVFRERFPNARWALMDVTDEVAKARIDAREGHFYKGAPPAGEKTGNLERKPDEVADVGVVADNSSNDKQDKEDIDNSEWNFAPVTFSHTILNGNDDVEVNAKKVVGLMTPASCG